MAPGESIKNTMLNHIMLLGQEVSYRLVQSKAAKSLRIRVTLRGTEVVLPIGRDVDEVGPFILANQNWVIEQLARIQQFSQIPAKRSVLAGQILFRGSPTQLRITEASQSQRTHRVVLGPEGFVLTRSHVSKTPLWQSFEYWLRRQSRLEIRKLVDEVSRRLNRYPGRVFLMGQRTKWGNCSPMGNLSFNWRLIMMPDHVMRYLVTHEVVHLAVPDHSRKFWLTVQSHCPDMSRAKAWLSTHTDDVMTDLAKLLQAEAQNSVNTRS